MVAFFIGNCGTGTPELMSTGFSYIYYSSFLLFYPCIYRRESCLLLRYLLKKNGSGNSGRP